MIKLQQKDIDRFWAKVTVGKPNECWDWQAGKIGTGYGQFWLKGNMLRAHRVAYVLGKFNQPRKFCVCHKCDNPSCCNPKHLFLGTRADNNNDTHIKKRHRYGESCQNTHLTNGDILTIRESNKTVIQLAEKYNVTGQAISLIKRGKSWKHVGGPIEDSSRTLTEKQVRKIKVALRNYHWGMNIELAKKYNVSSGLISHIKTGRLWRYTNEKVLS